MSDRKEGNLEENKKDFQEFKALLSRDIYFYTIRYPKLPTIFK